MSHFARFAWPAILLQTAQLALTAPCAFGGDPTRPAPLLREGIASFGAAVEGGWLYVYGGNTGKVHEHHRDVVSHAFRRLDLSKPSVWEELPSGPALQGAALVAHAGKIYRLGGLEILNARAEPELLRSTPSVATFDPGLRQWKPLPDLPEPRSSHDAVVVGSRLVVVGGWCLRDGAQTWHKTAWALDLESETASWSAIPPPPAPVRGAALAPASGGLWLVGGMASDGTILRSVLRFDPTSGVWERAADLPCDGFGVAAAQWRDRLLTSGVDGSLRVLTPEGGWTELGGLAFPRIFHRLLVVPGDASFPGTRVVALGGAGNGCKVRWVETVELECNDRPVQLSVSSIAFPGAGRARHTTFMAGGALHFAGGNRSVRQHDFAPENFVAEHHALQLGALTWSRLADLPFARQSMESGLRLDTAATGQTSRRAGAFMAFVLGGFSDPGDGTRSHVEVASYSSQSAAWERSAAQLPVPRTQFALLYDGERFWVFGGLDYAAKREGREFSLPTEVLSWDPNRDPAFVDTGHRLRVGRRAFAGALLGRSAYLVGGMTDAFRPVLEAESLDLDTGRWETIPSPSKPRVSPSLVGLQGRLLLLGGTSPRAGDRDLAANPSIEMFDPVTRRWTVVLEEVPFPAPPSGAHAMGDSVLLYALEPGAISMLHLGLLRLLMGKVRRL